MTDQSGQSWQPVAAALLGSWPNQVAAWGREAIAAYCHELAARGLDPGQALTAIRSCPATQAFPPSAAELAALGRRDPSQPTPEEAHRLIYASGGVLRARVPAGVEFDNEAHMLAARDQAAVQRAGELHPRLGSFVAAVGVEWLRSLNVGDERHGELRRKDFRDAWLRHCEAREGREVVAIASGAGRGGLRQLDPLAVLDTPRRDSRQLPAGTGR